MHVCVVFSFLLLLRSETDLGGFTSIRGEFPRGAVQKKTKTYELETAGKKEKTLLRTEHIVWG